MGEVSLETFEAQARGFLDGHASRRAEEEVFVWGKGSDQVTLFDEKQRDRELEELARAKEWRAEKLERFDDAGER